jgi:hypothetical protein
VRTANENVIRALARALAEARAGNVEAVAIVTVTPEGVPDASFGGESELMPSANIGLDVLKASIVHRVMKQNELATTKLVRAAN